MHINSENLFSKNILYYPNIEFFDDTWVKSTLCIWEKIYRIVPASYVPKDSDEIKIAIDNGLIENISLSTSDLSQTADLFEKFWKQVPVIPAGVEGWEEIDVNLSSEKVDARILPLLKSLSKKVDPNGWLKLSPEVANTYMLFLAETVSRRRQMPKLTDNSDMFSIMHYFTNDGNIDDFLYDTEKNEVTSTLVLTTLLPSGLNYKSIDKVIEFRKKFEEGRQLFRSSIMALSKELTRVEDPKYAQEVIKEFQQSLNSTNKSILKSIGQTAADATAAALSIGIPTTLTAIGAFIGMGDPFDFKQFGLAGMLGVVAALSDVLKNRRKDWKANESSYYLQLNKVFKNDDGQIKLSIPRYNRIIEEFIND